MSQEFLYGLDEIIKKGRIYLFDTCVLTGGWRRGQNPTEDSLYEIRKVARKAHLADIIAASLSLVKMPNVRTTEQVYIECLGVLSEYRNRSVPRKQKEYDRDLRELINYIREHKEIVYQFGDKEEAMEKEIVIEFLKKKFRQAHYEMKPAARADLSLVAEAFVNASYEDTPRVDIISNDWGVQESMQLLFDNLQTLRLNEKNKRRVVKGKCVRIYSRSYGGVYETSFDSTALTMRAAVA